MTVSTFVQPNYTAQSGSAYKGNIDAAIAAYLREAGAFAAHEQSTPDMTVRLDAGALFTGGSILSEVAAQSSGTITAPSALPRKDIVYVDGRTGAVGVATGAEHASPSDPSIPAGKLPIARVTLQTSTTAISNSILDDIRDLRLAGVATAIQNQVATYAVATGSSNAFAITVAPVPAARAAGQRWAVKANHAIDGSATLNVNSLGAGTLKKNGGADDLVTGDIVDGQIFEVEDDGTNYQVVSGLPASGGGKAVQVVAGTLTSTYSSGSTSWADTGLTVTTAALSDASNTCLVIANVNINSNNHTNLQIVRTSTAIGVGDAASSRTRAGGRGSKGDVGGMDNVTMVWLDTPGSAAAITFKVQALTDAGSTVYVNRHQTDTDSAAVGTRTASSIIVIEFDET